MELLTLLISTVPEDYRALAVIFLVAAYFGIPLLRERTANRTYWEFREHQLRLLDLAEKVPNSVSPELAPEIQRELEAQKALLTPDLRPRIRRKQYLAMVGIGSLSILTLISLYPAVRGDLSFTDAVFFAALPQSIVAFLLTLPLSSRSILGALLLGLGTGAFVHVLLIIITTNAA